MSAAFSAGSQGSSRSPRSVVAVSGHPQPMELLDALLVDACDYDVIFVESVACGYSRIKQLTPDLVIVFMENDDVAACQLLSMLRIDRDICDIPVVTWATRRKDSEIEEIVEEMIRESSCLTHAVQMN